jgi:hypothetical protein
MRASSLGIFVDASSLISKVTGVNSYAMPLVGEIGAIDEQLSYFVAKAGKRLHGSINGLNRGQNADPAA